MRESDLEEEQEPLAGSEAGLDALLRQLQAETGLNLKQYKPNYLKRRIGVRMRAVGCSDYLQYQRYARNDPEESRRLINDLTINVTEFFRDADVYEALRVRVIPELILYKKEKNMNSLRVWSAGCATGEEPYSVSMLLLAALAKEGNPGKWHLRITATDLDDKALDKAVAGRYEAAKVPPGLVLEDYFERDGEGYVVREGVRRPVKFLLMDIVKDPPLRHLDLILCRNLLIYFEREKQYQILDTFQRCLRPGGFLVLGKSESIIGALESELAPYCRRERIYRKGPRGPAGASWVPGKGAAGGGTTAASWRHHAEGCGSCRSADSGKGRNDNRETGGCAKVRRLHGKGERPDKDKTIM